MNANTIKFACPSCGQNFSAALADAGAEAVCPSCQTPFILPFPPPAASGRKLKSAPSRRNPLLIPFVALAVVLVTLIAAILLHGRERPGRGKTRYRTADEPGQWQALADNPEQWQALAEKGDAFAQALLARAYTLGTDGRRYSPVEAARWAKASADQKHPLGLFMMGRLAAEGLDITAEAAKEMQRPYLEAAVREGFVTLAERGGRQWMMCLGYAYQGGAEVTRDPAAAVQWYRKAAEAGDGAGMGRLGECYYAGIGTTKDVGEAAKWFRRAAEEGDSHGMTWLGACYMEGTGIAKDQTEGAKWYRKAAEVGNGRAMAMFAGCCFFGTGVPKDFAQGAVWYRKAAETHDARGMAGLGRCYFDGTGMQKDEAEAAKWLRMSAEAGDPNGMTWYGCCLATGFGVGKDEARAVGWFGKAAEAGSLEGMVYLGGAYLRGNGVAEDVARGFQLVNRAAMAGETNGMYMLGNCYLTGEGTLRNVVEGLKWFRRAGDAGNVMAMNMLGGIYLQGGLVEMDQAEAVKWYRKAAEAGDANAMAYLGFCYLKGTGVPTDLMEAERWLRKAAALGQRDAAEMLRQMSPGAFATPNDENVKLAIWPASASADTNKSVPDAEGKDKLAIAELTLKLSETVRKNMVMVEGGSLPPASVLAGQVVKSFFINRHEVTWDEWQVVRAYAEKRGYDLEGAGMGGVVMVPRAEGGADIVSDLRGPGKGWAANHPVNMIAWYQALKWCNALSEMQGLTPVYSHQEKVYRQGEAEPQVNTNANGYRLPTEAEWEWAARGGRKSNGYEFSGSNNADEVAVYWDNPGRGTSPVGSKKANELGLHDMSGNVDEWCWDIFNKSSSKRVTRGGNWGVEAWVCGVVRRGEGCLPYTDKICSGACDVGFRLARSSVPSEAGNVKQATEQDQSAGLTATMADKVIKATQDQPFVNLLGMKFVPAGTQGVLFCVWETRVKDFQAFVDATGYDAIKDGPSGTPAGTIEMDGNRVVVKQAGGTWKDPRFPPGNPQSGLHPVVCVSFLDAEAFCAWLTKREADHLPSGWCYRLPTDDEWSAACGTSEFPWGDHWPPDPTDGNYSGSDSWARTSPVGSFTPNRYGLFDMGGNVWELCGTWYRSSMSDAQTLQAIPGLKNDAGSPHRVVRGAAWNRNERGILLSEFRDVSDPRGRLNCYGFRVVLVGGVEARTEAARTENQRLAELAAANAAMRGIDPAASTKTAQVPSPARDHKPSNTIKVVEVMKDHIRSRSIKEFTFEQVLDWKTEADEVINGETYQTGLVSYKVETIFGVKTIEAKALIQNGRVVRWVWPRSGIEMK